MKNKRSGDEVGPEPETVVTFFNRGRQVAGDLLRENDQLRSRIRRLEGELRLGAVKRPGEGGNGTQRE